ncbi:MAG TPA: immunoglobulin domain-containing protein [Anaerohalosphaeraceae bacterium]|nr:immunoglobulin domain-containing protein [Phycisphaerae bacterium]HOK95940.1 immunoglobulin domain-containing protein [Anaerohalosphaeraceae bacterium]HOL32256.1 immunoglobulin domain-containing protein [Anaerohalosphaeraceae bacterium]HOM76824.1 immunoglobulin domain-containing protein [Anaerohalosphaeraceae bacterium]HPO69211.1 immunoglobulin domain-containing protein [Anaerohalosphaeraceae bacterium]
MKKLNSAVVIALMLSLSIGASAATLLWYDFEDGTPETVMNPGTAPAIASRDLSGNGYHMWGWASGTANNSPSFSALGDTPTGYGTSARYPVASKDGYTAGADAINTWSPLVWTIEVSAKLDSLSGWQTVIGRNGSSLGVAEADFYLQKNDIDDRWRINFGTVGGERFILDSDFVVEAGKWYHIAVVSDGTTVKMYVDKIDGNGYQLVGSRAFSGTNNALAQGNFVWTFGRGWYNGGNVDFVIGNIDDVRFSDAALTPDQFLHTMYDLGNPSPGHRSVNAQRSPTLSWQFINAGVTADSYQIYGPTTDPNLVDPNQPRTPDYTTTAQSQAIAGPLAYTTKYYWRVDAVVGTTVYTGPIWNFTTVPPSPVFSVNPGRVGAFPGESAVLTATCSSTLPLTRTIQWFKVGTPDVEITTADPDVSIQQTVNGELTTSTLTISNISLAHEAQYYARATNSGGSVNSSNGAIVVKRLLAWYQFEGNTNDSSGNNMHGTVMTPSGAAATIAYVPSVNEAMGQAVSFTGTGISNPTNTVDPYVDLPDGFSDFSQGLTFGAWVYPTAAANWARIVEFGNGTNGANNSIYFTRVGTGTTVRLENDNTNPSNNTSITTPSGGITLNEWQFLVVTVNKNATNNATIYRNGRPLVTGTINLPNIVTRTNCFIGRSEWYGDSLYQGRMDDVRIYNYGLTADEIAQMYYDIVGTFCLSKPVYDYDNNCIEDLGDLAIMAATWLDCGLYPATACP